MFTRRLMCPSRRMMQAASRKTTSAWQRRWKRSRKVERLVFDELAIMRTGIRASVLGLGIPLAAGPGLAGPPYVTDDPEPTDTGHFENYLYIEGTHAAGAMAGPSAGIEINYGVF